MKTHRSRTRVSFHAAVYALAVTSAVGAPAWAQEQASLLNQVQAELRAQSAVPWDTSRPLTWSDFTAPPPPDNDTPFAAQAVVGILHAIACDRAHLEYVVLAVFQTRTSWAFPLTMHGSDSAYFLAHEQGHFDLTEITARRLRAELEQFAVPCDSADTVFTRMGQEANARNDVIQKQYDSASYTRRPKGGVIHRQAQAEWLARIKATLDSLRRWDTTQSTRRY